MAAAARIGDPTSHGGHILPPGSHTVLIEGLPAATLGDNHICNLPPGPAHPATGPFVSGSPTVLIHGKPALRVGDQSTCGAVIIRGASTVLIG